MGELDRAFEELKDEMDDIFERTPKSADDLEHLPLFAILMVVGAYVAIGIGIFHFVLSILRDFDPVLIFQLIINVTFGFGLLVCYLRVKDKMERIRWGVLAVVFSLILIVLGGIVGALGGIIGVFGGALALLAALDGEWEV
ncbi:MAG: hypothetical protein ACOC55_01605 [Candidatus Natronoplasma sp.]